MMSMGLMTEKQAKAVKLHTCNKIEGMVCGGLILDILEGTKAVIVKSLKPDRTKNSENN
jgi:hypothetical protein